jgi:hypothetical protein
VGGLIRRIRGTSSVEDERELLRHAQESAARQLEAMKHELAERVQAVREREHALEEALTNAPGSRVISLPHLDDSEAGIDQTPLAGTSPNDAGTRERIEQRLADLREAEKLFLRTQAELASRSEAVAARERLLASRERALGDGDRSDSFELAELEARLRRLERAGAAPAGEDTTSFAGGLESLRRRGTRRKT